MAQAQLATALRHIRKLLDQIDEQADLSEPFTRIREALSEARKLGATSRGA